MKTVYKTSEQEREYMRRYTREHLEQERERARRWAQEHPQENHRRSREWKRGHRDRVNELERVARIKSPEIYRSAGRRCRAKLRQRIFDKLGHACVKCGFADERALCIDHVNGGGRQEKLAIRNQHKFLKKVIDDTSGAYQILCANCNMIKMVENREYRRVATVPGRE